MAVLLSVVTGASLSLAADKPGGHDGPKVLDQILSVSTKDKTITIYLGPEKSATYTVGAKAHIMINNKFGAFEGLKVGMKATVNHKAGSTIADSVFAQTLVKPKRGGHGKHH